MKIMVINLGSTSFKFKIFGMGEQIELLSQGGFEDIGKEISHYQIVSGEYKEQGDVQCKTHVSAFHLSKDIILKCGAIQSLDELDVIGYKAVHGGKISGVRFVDEELLRIMEQYISFAPAHNPLYIDMIREIKEQYPQLIQIAHFETMFHSTIPRKRVVYGVPYEWIDTYGIRKYGFHGSSHSYISHKMRKIRPEAKRIISIHLGGSSSLCAILDGKSVATTMGATPQSGIFHNNRIGEFDVFCLPLLVEQYENDINKVMNILSSKSGFQGLSGVSNDLRDIIQAARHSKDERAQLAIDAFVDGIVGYIGMYTAYLGGVDAIVFTGGIGQHSSLIRKMVCDSLQFLKVSLDADKMEQCFDSRISDNKSEVDVWVLETNEELSVAMNIEEYLRMRDDD